MRVSNMEIDRIYTSSAVRSTEYQMIETHMHNYYEMYYVRQGKCSIYIEGYLYSLNIGDIVIIPPKKEHFTRYLRKSTRINLYFNLSDLYDTDKSPFYRGVTDTIDQLRVIHLPSVYMDKVNGIVDNMLAEEKVDDEATILIQQLALRQILLYIHRYGIPYAAGNAAKTDIGIMTAVNYINNNYASPIRLDDLAKMANLNSTYFSKKFCLITGSGMKEYLNYVRLTHAAMELQSTNRSITEIAFDCGFSSSNYFKDAFKKLFQMSPRDFRKSKDTDKFKEQMELEQICYRTNEQAEPSENT